MARRWSCGFELQSVTAGVEFDAVNGSPTIENTIVRSGAASLKVDVSSSTASIEHSYQSSDNDENFARIYVRFASFPSSLTTIARFLDNAEASGTAIMVNSNGTLELWNGTTAQIGSDSGVLSTNTWYRIEWSHEAGHARAGYAVGGNNSTDIFAESDVSHADGDNMRRLEVGVIDSATCEVYFDDVAVNDAVASATQQMYFPGEGKIVHMHPDSAGTEQDQASGTWDDIEEVPPSDVDYIVLDDNNDDVYFNCESSSSAGISSGDPITLVSVGARVRGATDSNCSYRSRIYIDGDVEEATTKDIGSTTWSTHDDTAHSQQYSLTTYKKPLVGGLWTTSDLDSMEIGVRSPDADPDVWVSNIWALVEYRTQGSGDTTTYTFSGITTPSGTHVAREFMVDVKDPTDPPPMTGDPILGKELTTLTDDGETTGTPALRTGINDWNDPEDNEASDAQYALIDADDANEWTLPDYGFGDNTVFWARFAISETPADINQIYIKVRGKQAASTDFAWLGIWDSTNGMWIATFRIRRTAAQNYEGNLLENLTNFIDGSGYLYICLFNEDDSDALIINYVEVKIIAEAGEQPTAIRYVWPGGYNRS